MTKYSVLVKPGSSQEKVIKTDESEMIVYIRAKAHDGEANEALIKALAEYFDAPKTSLRIVRGATSRHKIIEF